KVDWDEERCKKIQAVGIIHAGTFFICLRESIRVLFVPLIFELLSFPFVVPRETVIEDSKPEPPEVSEEEVVPEPEPEPVVDEEWQESDEDDLDALPGP
ncbi:10999_t:CDS:2, partial [Diversispora eburnea]